MPDEQTENVKAYFDKLAASYDRSPPWDELTERIYDELTWHCIEPYLPQEGLVLDAGGGTGKWAILIAERGLDVVLCDLSERMLDVAHRKVKERGLKDKVRLMQGDIHNLPFPADSFDFILAEGVLEYCADLERAFRELVRVLKPGCPLAANVDSLFYVAWVMANSGELDEIPLLLREGKYLDEDEVYCNALTPEDFRALAEGSGLEVIKIIGKPVLCQYLGGEHKKALEAGERLGKLLELELSLCERSSLIGAGSHLQLMARKRG